MFLVSGLRFEKHSESESLDLEAANHMEKSLNCKGMGVGTWEGFLGPHWITEGVRTPCPVIKEKGF